MNRPKIIHLANTTHLTIHTTLIYYGSSSPFCLSYVKTSGFHPQAIGSKPIRNCIQILLYYFTIIFHFNVRSDKRNENLIVKILWMYEIPNAISPRFCPLFIILYKQKPPENLLWFFKVFWLCLSTQKVTLYFSFCCVI